MSNITRSDGLGRKTGAGLIDCKRALAETDGDMEEAISIFVKVFLLPRKQGEKLRRYHF